MGRRLAGLSWAVVRIQGYDAHYTVDGMILTEIALIKPHLSALTLGLGCPVLSFHRHPAIYLRDESEAILRESGPTPSFYRWEN